MCRILPVNVIWFNAMALSSSRFYETLKYGMLEVQEHLETFCDKRDQAMMVKYRDSVGYIYDQKSCFVLVLRRRKNDAKTRTT